MLIYAILGFLSYRSLTGYDLKQVMDHSTAYFWHATQSQIYRTLKELEVAAQVISSVEPQEGRPDRRVYTITEAGRAELEHWLGQPLAEITARKDELLLKVFFSAEADHDLLLAQLRLQRQMYQAQHDYFNTDLSQIFEHESRLAPDEVRIYERWDMARRFGVLYTEMYVRWLDETIRRLDEGNRK